MGYINKMEDNGRLDQIDALVTVDSPIIGFAGFDYGYGNCRQQILNDLDKFRKGIAGVMSATLIGTYAALIYEAIGTENQLNFLLYFIDNFDMKDLIETIINEESPSSSIREITDMSRTSDFMVSNVRRTILLPYKVITGYHLEPVYTLQGSSTNFRLQVVPEYEIYYRVQGIQTNHADINNIGHVVGTDNDPFSMLDYETREEVNDTRKELKEALEASKIANNVYAVAFWLHGLYDYYKTKSRDCSRAASWLGNYKSEWGDLIGGDENDGFIAEHSQVLPGTPSTYVREVFIDHKRASPPSSSEVFQPQASFDDDKTADVYSNIGAIHSILDRMDVEH